MAFIKVRVAKYRRGGARSKCLRGMCCINIKKHLRVHTERKNKNSMTFSTHFSKCINFHDLNNMIISTSHLHMDSGFQMGKSQSNFEINVFHSLLHRAKIIWIAFWTRSRRCTRDIHCSIQQSTPHCCSLQSMR